VDADHQILLMLPVPNATQLRPWDDVASGYGASRARAIVMRTARSIAPKYRLRILDDWPMASLGVHCVVAALDAGEDRDDVLEALNADPRVAWAQPLQLYRALAQPDIPEDGDAAWYLPALHAIASGRGVVVAEVDTGVDLEHPNLVGQWSGPRDFVGNGRFDTELHGTAVAGLIVARASAATETIGVAPGARLVPLRACWQVDTSAAQCTSFTLAKALEHALQAHARIINLSLTGPADLLLGRLIDRALERNTVVVAAADETPAGPGFPAQHAGVIAVAGGPVAGLPQTVLAPAQDVLTTIPHAALGFMSGSSFAAAQVTGLTALLIQQSPRLTPAQVRAVLSAASTADVRNRGSAHLDPCAALAAVVTGRYPPDCARPRQSTSLHQAQLH
jgi:subtilisin family serine protease